MEEVAEERARKYGHYFAEAITTYCADNSWSSNEMPSDELVNAKVNTVLMDTLLTVVWIISIISHMIAWFDRTRFLLQFDAKMQASFQQLSETQQTTYVLFEREGKNMVSNFIHVPRIINIRILYKV